MIRELATKRLGSPSRTHLRNYVHPFFRSHRPPHTSRNGDHHIALRAVSSAPATMPRSEVPSLNGIATSQNNGTFPIYSYKHYKPLPTVVFTQHEEETNDLIAGLKSGYVSSYKHFLNARQFPRRVIRLYTEKKKCFKPNSFRHGMAFLLPRWEIRTLNRFEKQIS